MKKVILVFFSIILVCLSIVVVRFNLAGALSYILGKSVHGKVSISEAYLTRDGICLGLHMKGVALRGDYEGTVGDVAFTLDFLRGISLKRIAVKNFDITIVRMKSKPRPFRFPLEYLEIRDGVIRLPARKTFVIIDTFTVSNINTDQPLNLEGHIRNGNHVGKVDLTGTGIYNRQNVDVKGEARFLSLNLARMSKMLKGVVDGEGTFHYGKNGFVFGGKAEGKGFELKETWLKKPVAVDRITADVFLSMTDNDVEIKIKDAYYKNTPFCLAIYFDNYRYSSLELASGFLDVRDVAHHATSDHSLQHLWNVLKGGEVKLKMLRAVDKGALTAELDMKNIEATYKGMTFTDIHANVVIDKEKAMISGLRGKNGMNQFHDGEVAVIFDERALVRAKGRYMVCMKEIPPFINPGDLRFEGGSAEGNVEAEFQKNKAPDVHGSGKLIGVEAQWKGVSFAAGGSYTFDNGSISFNPLLLRRESTNITCKGKWAGGNLNFAVRGQYDVVHLKPFFTLPYKMAGVADIDGDVSLVEGLLHVDGDLLLEDVAFEVPGYMKKESGTPARIRLGFSKKESLINVDHLLLDINGAKLDADGTIRDGRKIGGNIRLDVPDAKKVAGLFFIDEDKVEGNVSADLSIADLEVPIKKLPHITGRIHVNDGFLHLPFLPEPFQSVNLTADFKGSFYSIQAGRMVSRSGRTVLKVGTLDVEGLEKPNFSLMLDLERFDTNDFMVADGKIFNIPVIPRDSLFARVNGDVFLKAGEVTIGKITGKNLEIKGVTADRKISVSSLNMGIFGGRADIRGIIDLSDEPYLFTDFRMSRLHSDVIMQSFGGTGKEMTGLFTVSGSLKSEGSTSRDLVENMDGNLNVYSRNGIIKKWKFLSKLFGALNIYDLLRGKVDFTQDGLKYSKLGAVFTVDKGVFHTEKFLLDSPSMVLNGKGDLNLVTNQVNGSIHVSPLIAVDRTIDKVPILRSIVKKRDQGFLYLTYIVRGPSNDPELNASVTSTVGNKAVEILRNILVFPKEVFE